MNSGNKITLHKLLEKYPDFSIDQERFKEEYPGLYDIIEYHTALVEEEKIKELIENNWVQNYNLKRFFNLLTEEEIERNSVVDKLMAKDLNIDYKVYLKMQEEGWKYFDDVKILLTYSYPYYSAYSIGDTIETSEFIECSIYTNDIYKIIDIYLKTGEKVHDV